MMKSLTPLFRAALFALVFFMSLPVTMQGKASKHVQQRVIYVSPQGDDAQSGSRHRPMATVEGALERARALRTEGKAGDGIAIHLTAGTWQLSRPITLTAEDSGTEASPLIIEGEGMGQTILSGGMDLSGFREVTPGLWQMDLSPVWPMLGDVPQLFVNDVRAVCARTPNGMSFMPSGKAIEWIIDTVPDSRPPRNGLAATQIILPDEAVEALREATPSPTDMRITILHKWDLTRRYVQSICLDKKSLYVAGQRMQSWDRIDDPNSQFFLENDRSFLDAPGEFFVDRLSRTLYYIPREGEVAATAVVTVPLLTQLLEVKGSDAGVVEYVFIQGISFQHTRYVYPWQGDNPCQADALQDAAIELSWARSIAFEGCEVSHTGNWAMAFGLGCRDGKAERCYLHDLGGGGVKIGTKPIPTDEETMLTRRICVDNCIVRDGGHVFVQAVGILSMQASDNRITHNDISDFFYTGISVGWVWGYSHSPSTHNIVTYNHIHHIGWGALSDMGGIYTLGDARGTEVCHNRIHDIYSLGYGGWGLYTDEGTTGILMKDNLVYRCKSSGFHQHYGKDNMICNNIFVNSLRAQLEATRVEPDHLPFTFSHNIIQYEQGNMYGINWQYVNFAADENIYWNTRGAVTWNGASLEEWQKSGKDVHSLVVDPRLADVANEDFTPKNSEALKTIHFVPFNADEAGVYGDTAWTDLACYDASRHALFLKIVDQYEKRQ